MSNIYSDDKFLYHKMPEKWYHFGRKKWCGYSRYVIYSKPQALKTELQRVMTKYQNATVKVCEFETRGFGVEIIFKNSADEAEFILRESI